MNRVLVFILALAAVVGLAVLAFFMFDDSGGKTKGPLDVPSAAPTKGRILLVSRLSGG